MHVLKVFGILAVFVLLVDLVWLGLIMQGFYTQEIGTITRRSGGSLAPRWGAVVLVYLVIPAGIVLFVRPLLGPEATYWHALGWGALFGLVMYGVYDLTNLAVLEKWTVRVTLADMAWGGVLCGSSAVVMRFFDRWLGS